MFVQVLATLRAELFRSLLLQKIEFFDVHSASKLTNLISTELDSVRSFIFRNVSRDRGPRAILEVIHNSLQESRPSRPQNDIVLDCESRTEEWTSIGALQARQFSHKLLHLAVR